MYCLGLLLCYKKSCGLEAQDIYSVVVTEGFSAPLVGGDRRRLLQEVAATWADRQSTKPSLKDIGRPVGRLSDQVFQAV